MGLLSNYRLAKRVAELEDRLETAERHVKLLRTEWDDYYDKMRVVMARVVKRAERVEQSEQPEESSAPAAPPETGNGRLLTPSQLAIQQRILRRRAGI